MSDEAHQQNADPAVRPRRTALRPREVLTLVVVAVVLGTAVGFLIADHTSMSIAARVLASDAIVGLPGIWFAIVVTRRLARIEVDLHDQIDAELVGYNRGYMDCLRQRNPH